MRGLARGGLTVMLVACSLAITAGQSKPRFEVASVRRQTEPLTAANVASGAIPRALPGGRFNASHITVQSLLLFAYDLKPYRLDGGPAWIREDRFAVNASAGRDASAAEIKRMLQALLEERFGLVAHMEPRPMRLQALVLARQDGTLGPNIFRMDAECTAAVVNERRRTMPEKYVSPGANGMMSSCSVSGVDMLADYLMLRLGVPILDATGLSGPHYYSLTAELPPPIVSARLGAPTSDPSNLPALSTALNEQLGLKMESRQGPVDVLVIEAISQPTEN